MNIRQARKSKQDCDLIFALSNDPLVRQASFNTKPIEYDTHCKWFDKTVVDINTLFFLIFDNKDFVGQIRFNRKSETSKECIISLSITRNFRGKHIAKAFLSLGIEEMQKKWSKINTVIAEVKGGNIPSNVLFEKGNFELISSINTYKLDILPKEER